MTDAKTILTFILILIVGNAMGQNLNDLVTERIIYTVRLNDTTQTEEEFYNYLDSPKKADIVNMLCDLVLNGQITASRYWGEQVGSLPDYNNTVGAHLVKNYFKWDESIKFVPNTSNSETSIRTKRDNQVYRYLINSLSFQEEWYFNTESNELTKRVNGVILYQDEYTHNIGMKVSHYLPLNDTTDNEYKQENLLAPDIIYDVPVTKTDTEYCSDFNWWHNYLEASKREKFFNVLTYKALRDTVAPFEIYKPEYPFDSLMERSPYINTGLSKIYYGRSNWYSSDPLMFGMTDKKIMACCFELSNWTTVRKIRFHEEWYFNKKDVRFEKKVKGIGLIVNTYNEEGQVNGEKCLVYYKLRQ